MQRIAYLDGWRGFAVLSVLFAHFVSTYQINLGRFGVELFFVLSGRLMAEILFVREVRLPRFFARRFSRVYPALLVFSIVMLAFAGVFADGPTPEQFLASITFTLNYAMTWIGRSPVTDHIWSLCIEEHMYVLLGIVAFVHRRKPLPLIPLFSLLAAVGISLGFLQTASGLDYYAVYWHTHVRGASLLLGVIAYLALSERQPKALDWTWWPIVFGIAGVVLHSNRFADPIKYSLGTACLALSLVLMPRAPRFALQVLENPLLLRIGVWSYSLYIWQQPFSKLAGEHLARLGYLAIAVVAALLSFYLVEQPARKYLNRLVDRLAMGKMSHRQVEL